MELIDLVVWLIIGTIVGWLANSLMKGKGFGLRRNITIGVIGAIIGGALLPLVDFVLARGLLGGIINAFIGAAFLATVVKFARRAT